MNLYVHGINGELFVIIDLAGFYLDLQKNKQTGPVVSRSGQIFAGRPFAIHGATNQEKKREEMPSRWCGHEREEEWRRWLTAGCLEAEVT
jgi:hypothetical protein